MVMSPDQNAGRSQNMKIDSTPFEVVEQFKYLGTSLTHQNYIQEEIKRRLNSRNACYLSMQDLLSSSLLSTASDTKHVRLKLSQYKKHTPLTITIKKPTRNTVKILTFTLTTIRI